VTPAQDVIEKKPVILTPGQELIEKRLDVIEKRLVILTPGQEIIDPGTHRRDPGSGFRIVSTLHRGALTFPNIPGSL